MVVEQARGTVESRKGSGTVRALRFAHRGLAYAALPLLVPAGLVMVLLLSLAEVADDLESVSPLDPPPSSGS